jgi:hypothetical protein
MTRTKFLALCAGKKNNKGFNVYHERGYDSRNVVNYRVRLDPGVGFPSGHAILYTTTHQSKAIDADNRFNMWLIQEKLHHDQQQAVGGAD